MHTPYLLCQVLLNEETSWPTASCEASASMVHQLLTMHLHPHAHAPSHPVRTIVTHTHIQTDEYRTQCTSTQNKDIQIILSPSGMIATTQHILASTNSH